MMVEACRLDRGPISRAPIRGEWHCRVIGRDRILLAQAELPGDRGHFRVLAAPARISRELSGHIAAVEPGKTRGAGTVAKPVDAMAGEAGIGRATIAAAERNELT
ncbi:MAG: hypothetical protein QHC67_10140 [Sphingobium sp.]|nr:hypothetical protein [Sphingobium sp.]MDX3910165.1 hypothetical protein [Sphingobium sp.]